MKTILTLLFLVAALSISSISNAQVKTFEKAFGGNQPDFGHALNPTSDGGFILTGATYSFADSGVTATYLIKINANGDKQWERHYGGPKVQGGNSVVQTPDGGYFVTNHTENYGTGNCD